MRFRQHEVVVVGGGTAGALAAIAAARNGADTLLVEHYGYLGGTMTAGLMIQAGGFHTQDGEFVIRGLAEELAQRVTDRGGAVGIPMHHRRESHHGPHTAPTGYSHFWFDPEVMKKVLQEMALESELKLLLHSMCVDVLVEGNCVRGVVVENKSGRQTILAKMVIDASGDGDVAYKAGAETAIGGVAEYWLERMGEENPTAARRKALVPATLMFSVANIDEKKLRQHIQENQTRFECAHDAGKLGLFLREFVDWDEVHRRGELYDEADPEQCSFIMWPTQKGVAIFNATRVMNVDCADAEQLTRAELRARDQAWMVLDFCRKYIPGFENSFMMATATQTEPRETRRIIGRYVMTEEDILVGRKFEDVVAKGATNLDIHSPLPEGGEAHHDIAAGGTFDIPFNALRPKGLEGILVVGRCMSGTALALTSLRYQSVCFSTGQAAGTIAALSVKNGDNLGELDINQVQKTLSEQGQVLKSKS